MIPACPTNQSIDVKKSSFKKLSTFLSVMAQEGIIKVKEQIKGVESIVEVNLVHPSIRAFVLRLDDVPEEQASADAKKTNTSPNIVELYKITAHVLPIFKNFNHK
jgi:translation initiation factor 2D